MLQMRPPHSGSASERWGVSPCATGDPGIVLEESGRARGRPLTDRCANRGDRRGPPLSGALTGQAGGAGVTTIRGEKVVALLSVPGAGSDAVTVEESWGDEGGVDFCARWWGLDRGEPGRVFAIAQSSSARPAIEIAGPFVGPHPCGGAVIALFFESVDQLATRDAVVVVDDGRPCWHVDLDGANACDSGEYGLECVLTPLCRDARQ